MEQILLLLILFVLIVVLVVLFLNYIQQKRLTSDNSPIQKLIEAQMHGFEQQMRHFFAENRQELGNNIGQMQDSLLKRINENVALQKQQLSEFDKKLLALQTSLSQSQQTFLETVNTKQNNLQTTINERLKEIREDNTKQLEQIRHTVDEKLQTTLEKRLGESFKLVSERLELVHKGLGEMQGLAAGVGDLKKVLTNVKTRGILGEYQLGKILEQILTPQQYAQDVQPVPNSRQHVEFAVKLPGKDEQSQVWLPIDSKFPIESYQHLLDAYEQGDKAVIETAQKELTRHVEAFAKDISSKYIAPPHTTDFAIMFLPVEGLYAEVMRHIGLFEKLQRQYKVTITGPSTLSALLNSLNMGFRTLAVQQRSSEVWEVLKAVKTEFEKFEDHLAKVQKQLHTASSSLETLSSTRTNAINRKLRHVETLNDTDTQAILNIPNSTEQETQKLDL